MVQRLPVPTVWDKECMCTSQLSQGFKKKFLDMKNISIYYYPGADVCKKLSSDCPALERVSYPAVSIDLILLITICCALRYAVLLFLFDCSISSSSSSPPLSSIIQTYSRLDHSISPSVCTLHLLPFFPLHLFTSYYALSSILCFCCRSSYLLFFHSLVAFVLILISL